MKTEEELKAARADFEWELRDTGWDGVEPSGAAAHGFICAIDWLLGGPTAGVTDKFLDQVRNRRVRVEGEVR